MAAWYNFLKILRPGECRGWFDAMGSIAFTKLRNYYRIYDLEARQSSTLDIDAVTSAVKNADRPAPIKPNVLIKRKLIPIDTRTLDKLTNA